MKIKNLMSILSVLTHLAVNAQINSYLEVEGKIQIGNDASPEIEGMIRYNQVTQDFEGYNGTEWLSLTTKYQSTQKSIGTQKVNEKRRLLSSDGGANHEFGSSVAIQGLYAAVGTPGHSGNGLYSGAVYIFKKEGTQWIEKQKLTPSDATEHMNFGSDLAFYENFLIIGAHGNMYEQVMGGAYIFTFDGTWWQEDQRLFTTHVHLSDGYGSKVAIYDQFALVSAPLADTAELDAGAVYVFKNLGSGWVEQNMILASDPAVDDAFGSAVDICEDYVAITALYDDGLATDGGSLYIFKYNGPVFNEVTEIEPSNAHDNQTFGIDVSIRSNRIIVGALYDNTNGVQAGAAYIFEYNGTTWKEQAMLLPGDSHANMWFGGSVYLFGDCAIVGASADDDLGIQSGSAYLFQRVGDHWVEVNKLLPNGGNLTDRFGFSVAGDTSNIIIGAYWDDQQGAMSGSAFIF
jgi:hypothetical protein